MRLPGLNGGMKLGTGLAVGAAVVILAPMVLPVVTGVLKSLTKAGLKGGMVLYQKGLIAAEEAKETIEDLAAEARVELSQEQEVPAAATKKRAAASGAK
jgi:hypothetical protein